ncbi:hypothetical protein V5F76_07605 [Xanthobacter agilis]
MATLRPRGEPALPHHGVGPERIVGADPGQDKIHPSRVEGLTRGVGRHPHQPQFGGKPGGQLGGEIDLESLLHVEPAVRRFRRRQPGDANDQGPPGKICVPAHECRREGPWLHGKGDAKRQPGEHRRQEQRETAGRERNETLASGWQRHGRAIIFGGKTSG